MQMNTSLALNDPGYQTRRSFPGEMPVVENAVDLKLAELEKRVLAMDHPSRITSPSTRTLSDFEARLPQLIEREVNARFQQMTATLQREVEETNIHAIEVFVKSVQTKLVHRISLLEANMNKQAQSMTELRECSQRTEDNLVRLISGVEKLSRELPARIEAARS
jgi:hypothetical protein